MPEIRAWIVAIEKYGGGAAKDELDIGAPVGTWALDLAELLVAREVPGNNIVLSISHSEGKYAARVEDLRTKSVAIRGATQAELQNALARLKGKGALLIYWVGHGIMNSERRFLLAADSSKTGDLRALGVDSLLKHLRAAVYPRLQIGFFDCCAQVVGQPNTLDFGGEGKAATSQFFYYAASATESAAADTTRPGFSSTAIQALSESGELPPNPAVFFPMLRGKLAELPLATRPFLQWTEESGEVWSRSGGSRRRPELADEARRAELALSQFEHLFRQAEKCGLTASQLSKAISKESLPKTIAGLREKDPEAAAIDLLERAWERVGSAQAFEDLGNALHLFWSEWLVVAEEVRRQDNLGPPEGIDDLPALLLSVLDQNKKAIGLRSFIKLLELAARRAKGSMPKAANALSEALRAHELCGPYFEAAIGALPRQSGILYLLLGLQIEPNTRKPWLQQCWIYSAGKAHPDAPEIPKDGMMADQINSVVQTVLELYPDRTLLIELLSPNDLLCAPRELLEIVNREVDTSIWLEASHAITVRWHDRMKGAKDFQPGTWAQAAREAHAAAESAERLAFSWWKERKAPIPGKLCHVIGLDFPGPSPNDPQRNRGRFFNVLVKTGAPYMCWPRENPAKPKSFQTETGRLMKGHKLERLPHVLMELKRKDRHVLRDLVLFIDEPDRNPYNQKFQSTPRRAE